MKTNDERIQDILNHLDTFKLYQAGSDSGH